MKLAAGILVYRRKDRQVEVLIVHPGGPYFSKKDTGVWSIPKGLVDEGEEPLEAAKREFREEVGIAAPGGETFELGEVFYPRKSKMIKAWAVEGDVDLAAFKSNTFEKEWPPRSGRKQTFVEVDKAEWHSLEEAYKKLFVPQRLFIKRLADNLNLAFTPAEEQKKEHLGLL